MKGSRKFVAVTLLIIIAAIITGCNKTDSKIETGADYESVQINAESYNSDAQTELSTDTNSSINDIHTEDTTEDELGYSDIISYLEAFEYREDNSDKIRHETLDTNCKVFVNGVELSSDYPAHMFHSEGYSALPFTAIMEALGAAVEWKDDYIAVITYENNKYILDIKGLSFISISDGDDYMFGLGGNNHSPYYGYTGEEFVLDSDFVRCILSNWKLAVVNHVSSSIVIIENIDLERWDGYDYP